MKNKTYNKALFAGAIPFALISFFQPSIAFASTEVSTAESLISEIADSTSTGVTLTSDIDTTATLGTIKSKTFAIDGGGYDITDISGLSSNTNIIITSGTTFSISNVGTISGFYGYGGSIYNNSGTVTLIDADFSDNYASYAGGAIYNRGSMGTVSGNFTENSSASSGGAIYNYSTITSITGAFTENTSGSGGAIYNSGTITTLNSSFYSNEATSSQGGAIYNKGTITTLNSSFYNNISSGNGGAISNVAGSIITITGVFNYNESGGQGGAIYNYNSASISAIYGSFTGNTAELGAAIFNQSSTIGIIDADFTDNHIANNGAEGGAIRNTSGASIDSITGTFTNNYAIGTSSGLGGAISNGGTIDNVISAFINNYATASSSGKGGAIYNSGTIQISSLENTSIYNYGNYVASSAGVNNDEYGGFLYNTGVATFNTAKNSSITIGDGTAGYDSIAGTGTINKTGAGTLTVNSSMEFFTGTLNVEAGTMEVNKNLGASTITIGSDTTTANLSLQVNTTPTLTSESLSTITVYDDSFLSLIASANLTAEQSYSISLNSGFSMDSTNVKTFGGTFNGSVFTASALTDITIDDTGTQSATVTDYDRIAISTTSTSENATIVMSFSELTNSDTIINSVSSDTVSLDSYLSDSSVVAEISDAFYFDVENLADGDSVVLSFLVDASALTSSDFTLYHKEDDGEWEIYDVDVTYDGQYLSFTVDGFSSYGYSAVPEPSTYAMIFGVLALGLAVYRRRK